MIKRLKEFWRAIRRGEYGTTRAEAYSRGHKIGDDFLEKHLGAKEDGDGLDR